TLNAESFSDRGLKVFINDIERKIEIIFDINHVNERHQEWIKSVENRVGHLNNFEIVPYWGFDDIFHKAGTKLKNCFYVRADVKREGRGRNHTEKFLYNYVLKLSNFSQTKFVDAIRHGKIYVDFDARTGHNHGTKFRIRYNDIPTLYEDAEVVIDGRMK
ncbi:MAG: MvaI/BcnI restriction endonuclease family protein, partial [Prevotella sp.]|nr:MvaI/BcnI restriction endonuclease family protein [Prevotella sp.]